MTNEKLMDAVRTLKLEVQKIELENQLAQLKAEPTVVKKQNQILLHIKAELEFIKQHPFDPVLIDGSVENIFNVIKGQTEPIIDGDCIGCAGPCSDRIKEWLKAGEGEVARLRFIITREHGEAAKLQKELDEYKEAVWLERIDHKSVLKTVNQYHHAKIKDLEDDNSSLRDTIDQMAKKWSRDRATIKNFKTIETRETDGLHKTILDMDVTISDLMDNDKKINGFLDEYRVTVDNRDKTIKELKYRNAEDLHELYDLDKEEIDRLKDELSARKHDSEVLMEVVDIIKDDTIPNSKVPCMIYQLVDAYIDAPEVPPIDEPQDIKVTFAFLELP